MRLLNCKIGLKLHHRVFFNTLLSAFIECYLELAIVSFLQARHVSSLFWTRRCFGWLWGTTSLRASTSFSSSVSWLCRFSLLLGSCEPQKIRWKREERGSEPSTKKPSTINDQRLCFTWLSSAGGWSWQQSLCSWRERLMLKFRQW